MIESARPSLDRVKYAVVLAGAMAVLVSPSVAALTPVASAQRVWDVEFYDNCTAGMNDDQMTKSIEDQKLINKRCCEDSGGIFQDDGYIGKCVAPPAEPAAGSRQLPGNVRIPSDIAAAPTVTNEPPRPIRVPTAVASVSAVS
jgi:hypothetical protein